VRVRGLIKGYTHLVAERPVEYRDYTYNNNIYREIEIYTTIISYHNGEKK